MNPDNQPAYDLFDTLNHPGQDPNALALTFDELEDTQDPTAHLLANTLVHLVASQAIASAQRTNEPAQRRSNTWQRLREIEHTNLAPFTPLSLIQTLKELQTKAALAGAFITSHTQINLQTSATLKALTPRTTPTLVIAIGRTVSSTEPNIENTTTVELSINNSHRLLLDNPVTTALLPVLQAFIDHHCTLVVDRPEISIHHTTRRLTLMVFNLSALAPVTGQPTTAPAAIKTLTDHLTEAMSQQGAKTTVLTHRKKA